VLLKAQVRGFRQQFGGGVSLSFRSRYTFRSTAYTEPLTEASFQNQFRTSGTSAARWRRQAIIWQRWKVQEYYGSLLPFLLELSPAAKALASMFSSRTPVVA